jgi:hypothetical protein
MKVFGLFAALTIIAATACTAERAVSPQPSARSAATLAAPRPSEVPLLFVVDGVRYPKDHMPPLSSGQVASVQVIKGRRALAEYGPDGSYGVVLITTKQASGPRA